MRLKSAVLFHSKAERIWEVSGFDETQAPREENDAHFSRVVILKSELSHT